MISHYWFSRQFMSGQSMLVRLQHLWQIFAPTAVLNSPRYLYFKASVGSVLCLLCCLCGCSGGGSSGGAGMTNMTHVPDAPAELAANAGDGAVSLAWNAPISDGGAAIAAYGVSVSPAVATSQMTVDGTAAVISGLANGTTYTFSVAATNSAGTGAASTDVQAVPSAASPTDYVRITIASDPIGLSGAFDPAPLLTAGGAVWLAYSSAHYYRNAAQQLVQDVSTSLASSADGGGSYTYSATPGLAHGPVTVTDQSKMLCGQPSCTGRWVYEVPFLIEDPADPASSRRYKLFAHKYFLYPPATPATIYELGAIVMWTAGSLNGTWSPESTVFSWNLTPPELGGGTNINALDSALSNCLVISEGAGAVQNNALDFAFACSYSESGSIVSKIVLLRSADHAQTFSYVSTLLMPSDATIVPGAAFFTAPALLPHDSGARVLVVTGDDGQGRRSGCIVLPFDSESAGTLIRGATDLPLPIRVIPALGTHQDGACAWDRGIASSGMLMDDIDTSLSQPFGILATRAAL
jgi:hypothetical protein